MLLVSIHIPKTAGTTFGAILRRRYGEKFLYVYNTTLGPDYYCVGRDHQELFLNQADEKKNALHKDDVFKRITEEGIECVHGHFNLDLFEQADSLGGKQYITWIRDPYVRTYSEYLHHLRNGYRVETSEEKEVLVKNLANRMTDMIGNDFSKFAFIGRTEYFNEDLKRFGFDEEYETLNVTPEMEEDFEARGMVLKYVNKDGEIALQLIGERFLLWNELQSKNHEIAWMKNSIFWKLRAQYLRAKWGISHPIKLLNKYVFGVTQRQEEGGIKPEEIFYKVCNDLLSFLPKQFPSISARSSKKSVLVETRVLPHTEFVIKNTIQKLGEGWGHMIFCSKKNYEQIKSISDSISSHIEIIILKKSIRTREDYNNLLLSKKFWNQINCEKVLVYQTDTFIFKNLDEQFLKYDYVGAPWSTEHSEYIHKRLPTEELITHGNGGLSIRSVSMIKNILNRHTLVRNIFEDGLRYCPEDLFFAYYAHKENYAIAPKSVAEKFSYEYIFPDGVSTFGAHQPWLHLDKFLKQVGGVNILGFLNGVFGLAKSARVVHELLAYCHIPHNLVELPADHHNRSEYLIPDNNNFYPVNIVCCNADYVVDPALLQGKYNIGVWYWEFQVLPDEWKKRAKSFDEIWVATEFLKEVFEKELPDTKVVLIPVPFKLPRKIERLLARKAEFFQNNIEAHDNVTLFSFDYYSDEYRKNPAALVQAFLKAFPSDPSYKLVIKSQNGTEERKGKKKRM
jgi:hypothetical protein